MKTVTVSRKSWHYWLAERGCFWPEREGDLCHYIGAVLMGVTLMLSIAWLVIIAAFVAGDFIGWLAAVLAHGWVAPGFLAIVGLFALAFGVVHIGFRGARAVAENVEFVHDAYASLRDHICYRLEIK